MPKMHLVSYDKYNLVVLSLLANFTFYLFSLKLIAILVEFHPTFHDNLCIQAHFLLN